MIVVTDTSALFASFDRSHPDQDDCRAVMTTSHLALSPLVLTELDHLLHRDIGWPAAVAAVGALLAGVDVGRFRLPALDATDLARAQGVRSRYASLRLDLADAVGVVLADRFGTNEIFTLDQRDFRAITPLTARFDAFRLLPADG